MQSTPMSSCRCTTCAMPDSMTAGSGVSPANRRDGSASQPGATGSRPAWVVRIRSVLRFMSLLDVGGADHVAVELGLGLEPAREFRRSGELDLHERRLEAFARGL